MIILIRSKAIAQWSHGQTMGWLSRQNNLSASHATLRPWAHRTPRPTIYRWTSFRWLIARARHLCCPHQTIMYLNAHRACLKQIRPHKSLKSRSIKIRSLRSSKQTWHNRYSKTNRSQTSSSPASMCRIRTSSSTLWWIGPPKKLLLLSSESM